jgi:hypothetical protein
MRYSFVVLLLLGLICPVAADDAAVFCDSGTVKLIKPEHSSIRMLWERVDARLTGSAGNGYEAKVRCEFVFRNEGSATTVQIGFPEVGGGSDEQSFGSTQMISFRSWVDGVPITTRYVRERKGYGDYSAWHIKPVHFRAGQTVTVVDEYVTPYYWQRPEVWFYYILRSGSSWKGKIGKATITVDTSTVARDFAHCSAWPKGYRRHANKYTWVLRNFEPKKDISVGLLCSPLINCSSMDLWNLKIEHGTTVFSSNDDFVWLSVKEASKIRTDRKPGSRTCAVRYGNRYVRVTAGSRVAATNGRKAMRLPTAPYIDRDGFFWIPLVALRGLGMSISYEKENWNVVAKLPTTRRPGRGAQRH